tara:strand:+ start:67 stop:456 length:390 start_codon:yes stop_codon:yes gene_type:complete
MEEIVGLLKEISPYSPTKDAYENIWAAFYNQPNLYSRVAIHEGMVVGYGAIIIERKIRGGKLGHIEDIVSHPNFRGQNIGATIVKTLYRIAKNKGCYKVALHCSRDQAGFYEKCLLKIAGYSMQRFSSE